MKYYIALQYDDNYHINKNDYCNSLEEIKNKIMNGETYGHSFIIVCEVDFELVPKYDDKKDNIITNTRAVLLTAY